MEPKLSRNLKVDVTGIILKTIAEPLNQLGEGGMLVRRQLLPAGGPHVYQLTVHGPDLLGVIEVIASWVIRSLRFA
ncbi:winged helix-turn-helix transcriptional regulator [Qipengyuania sp. 6B39]|uniref:winged helix-turn-helix transcriptional regulator n=1 Tax=Qipengyuania proteolytica TaxID=2867239 RepID=UPI001C891E14|nr:winged helix-turn-helix transcriptional regulator [Qipengyuania proteolytica]